MPEDVLLTEKRDKVTILTLNRPQNLNALNGELQNAIIQSMLDLRKDDSVWAVVLMGAGRGFCSGADLRGGPRPAATEALNSRERRLDTLNWVGKLAIAIYRTLDKPIIAAVNGVAAGAGMSVALACDMRVGCENTRFKTVFIERNLSTDTGMSYFLPRIVGYSRACDLVYTSRNVDAQEAYRIGLLDRLVPAEKLLEEAVALANQVVAWPPVAMQSVKRVLQQSMETSLEDQLRNETLGLLLSARSPEDAKESRASFLEKRAPKFTGN